MSYELTVAVVQLNSGESKCENFATAAAWMRRAVDAGAGVVVLPEYFNCLGDRRTMTAEAEPLGGPTTEFLQQSARSLGATIVGGTFCERIAGSDKAHNTSLVVDPRGEIVAVYRKMHLFDVDLPGRLTYCESSWLAPGHELATYRLGDFQAAEAVCYDLRFPEMFRLYADRGVEVVVVPAAFTKTTGRDHWELLLRARAVENQCYVVAANQTGRHAALETFGHSMIVDPWGTVVARLEDEVGMTTFRLSQARIAEVRGQLPALEHRRFTAIAPPTPRS